MWQALNEANWDLEGHAARAAIALQPGLREGSTVPNPSVLALGATGDIPASLVSSTGARSLQAGGGGAAERERGARVGARPRGEMPTAWSAPRDVSSVSFQLTQSSTKAMIMYGFSNAGRAIHFDEVNPPTVDAWMGHSVGRWEGDTLIVEVTQQNDQTWFDRAGNFHGADMRVIGRYTPLSRNHLWYEATIEAPATFTAPWTIEMPLYSCHEGNYGMMNVLRGARKADGEATKAIGR